MATKTAEQERVALGLRIKAAREAAGLTQTDLSTRCGWPPRNSRVAGYESGNREPNIADIHNMAEQLGVDASMLVGSGKNGAKKHQAFAQRLHAACTAKGFPERGRASKLRGLLPFSISEKGIKKWLDGESIPRKMLSELAKVLAVSPAWLLLGDSDGAGQSVIDVRRNNLQYLILNHNAAPDAPESRGDLARFADSVGTSASTLSQIISPSIEKNLGEQLARKIEQALGLDHGWMDRIHDLATQYDTAAVVPAVNAPQPPTVQQVTGGHAFDSNAKRRLLSKLNELDQNGLFTDSLATAMWMLLDEFSSTAAVPKSSR